MDIVKKDFNVDIIENLPSLKEDTISKLNEFKEDIVSSLTYSKKTRTKLEFYIGAINDFVCPTIDSKYWQILLEMNGTSNSIIMYLFDLKKKQLYIKKQEKLIETLEDEIDREIALLEIEKLKYECKQIELTLDQLIKELKNLVEIKKDLEQHLEFSKEDFSEHQLYSNTKKLINDFFVAVTQKNSDVINSIYPFLYSCFKIMKARNILKDFISQYDEKARNILDQWFQVNA